MIVALAVAALLCLGACSSSSKSHGPTPRARAPQPVQLLRWRQCIKRHGVTLPALKAARRPLSPFSLQVAIRRNPQLRKRIIAHMLTAPSGVNAERYRSAALACAGRGRNQTTSTTATPA